MNEPYFASEPPASAKKLGLVEGICTVPISGIRAFTSGLKGLFGSNEIREIDERFALALKKAKSMLFENMKRLGGNAVYSYKLQFSELARGRGTAFIVVLVYGVAVSNSTGGRLKKKAKN